MLKYILFFIVICTLLFFVFLIIFLLLAYLFIYYLLQINTNFLDYNIDTKKILDKYRDFKIQKMYYYKQDITNLTCFIINLVLRYKYYNHLKLNHPYHVGCILILKNSYNDIKILKIHKSHTGIYIYDNFKINSYKKIKNVSIHKNKYTLNEMLDITKKNMGEKNFFNWELKNNNCEDFVKNLIKSIQKKTKKIQHQTILFNESDVYLINIVCILFSSFNSCLNLFLV